MRHYLLYIVVILLNFALTLSSYGQTGRQRTFVTESQPDSPLLIKDLSAIILLPNKYRSSLGLGGAFYVENISKKKIKQYTIYKPAEKDLGSKNDRDSQAYITDLLPGELFLHRLRETVEGDSLIFRVKEVEFADGTKWTAKAFNAAKAKNSARITATAQKIEKNTKPKKIITREWGVPIFNDGVFKVINAEPQIIEGITVQTKLHQLKSERIDEIEDCHKSAEELEKINSEMPDEIIDDDEYYTIEKFTTYEINGRTFAFEVPYMEIETETEYIRGNGSQLIYVDEDGSGFFKKRCGTAWLEPLPEWVKFQAGK